MSFPLSSMVRGGVLAVLTLLLVPAARSDDAAPSLAPAAEAAEEAAAGHPLAWTYRYASARREYIRQHVRDYSCRLIKRERIDGDLQDYQFMDVQMRCEQAGEVDREQPMSVFLRYLAPKLYEDRRVLYVAGKHDGRVLVRKGGRSMKYLKLELDPHGRAAQRESNYPITELGFDKTIDRLVDRVRDDIEADPMAVNTQVSHFRNARVGQRACTHIQVVHPDRQESMQYHQASLYIDDELQLPIRLVVHDWPDQAGAEPPLLEEFIYTRLKLNVGLTDAAFSESRLDSATGEASAAAP